MQMLLSERICAHQAAFAKESFGSFREAAYAGIWATDRMCPIAQMEKDLAENLPRAGYTVMGGH